jgi:hypothetical protein
VLPPQAEVGPPSRKRDGCGLFAGRADFVSVLVHRGWEDKSRSSCVSDEPDHPILRWERCSHPDVSSAIETISRMGRTTLPLTLGVATLPANAQAER